MTAEPTRDWPTAPIVLKARPRAVAGNPNKSGRSTGGTACATQSGIASPQHRHFHGALIRSPRATTYHRISPPAEGLADPERVADRRDCR